ncbi:MAG: class I SAM-dependent RNA methyltransferase [Rubellimicrobium sp.]|nr:class I SAM-dependent RNA methyltransferase [Rubellimicrobium sp.]
MGRAEDGTLIPRTLPDEEVAIDGDQLRILTPSPDRVAPPCRHFRNCGGCAMQHASDGFVERWKQGIVERALAGQGLRAEVAGITTSPPQSRRRARLSARRTKKGAMVGFHARASDVIVEVPDCRLLTPGLMALFPALEELAARLGTRKGEMTLTITESLTGADVVIEGGKPLEPADSADLAGFMQSHGIARLVLGETALMRVGPVQRLGRAEVVPPPGAFLQATAHGQAALTDAVLRMTHGAARIADLFAGCGTFALPLAERAEVHAVEGDAAMTQALDRGWRQAAGLKRVTTEARDLFRRPLLPEQLARLDAVVIDPPRAGAEAQVAEIARARVPVVAMVSCNPVTFARDARALVAAGYDLGPVEIVDQFRWSTHVELAARFTIS